MENLKDNLNSQIRSEILENLISKIKLNNRRRVYVNICFEINFLVRDQVLNNLKDKLDEKS